MKDEPWSPPLVILSRREPITAFLLARELHEHSGECHASVMQVRERRGEPFLACRRGPGERSPAVEPAGAYRQVPRRVRRRDGAIRCGPSLRRRVRELLVGAARGLWRSWEWLRT